MSYGWYLGQLHQSGYDIAGIFLFMTGAVGLLFAVIFYLLTRKYPWHEKWYLTVLTGLAGCGIVFVMILGLSGCTDKASYSNQEWCTFCVS